MIWDATSSTAAVTTGTTTIAAVMRRRVRIVDAGVAATAVRIREKSSSGGLTSDSNRDRIPRSVMVVFLPSGCAEGIPELFVGAMGALPHDRRRRSEHGGRFPHAEPFLLQQDVRDSVLLRHPAELRRHDPQQVARENLGFRGVTVDGRESVVLRRIVRRTEILRAPAPVPESIEMGRARNRKCPVQYIRAGQVGGACAMDPEQRLLEQIVCLRLAGRETQAEAIEARRHQSIQRLEDAVLPPCIAFMSSLSWSAFVSMQS